MKKSGAAVLIMLLLLTGCGDTLDEKLLRRRNRSKYRLGIQRYSLRIVLKNIARRPSSRDML